jgi:hypothetical protein
MYKYLQIIIKLKNLSIILKIVYITQKGIFFYYIPKAKL